jgi:hypothetical protein
MGAGLVTAPIGLHVYTGRGGVSRSRARDLRAAGVRGVILCAEAVDGWTASVEQARGWGVACAAAGLDAGAYAFPGTARTAAPGVVAAGLVAVCQASDGLTAVADVEAPYRGRPAALTALLDAVAAQAATAGVGAASTTLGLPSDRGTRWPWPALLAWHRQHPETWLGWQCYERARADRLVDAGIAELQAAIGPRVVPHLATYPRRTATAEGLDGPRRLVADLDRACLGADGRPCVPGVVLWSDASIGDDELAAIKAWTARAGW